MASTATLHYRGNLHTDIIHNQSGTSIATDAPTDNGGKGEAFSPTDLVASALAACAMTIMGLKANALGIEFSQARAEIQKSMDTSPRRISAVTVDFYIAHDYSPEIRQKLEAAAYACPVAHSLSADLQQNFNFHYGSE